MKWLSIFFKLILEFYIEKLRKSRNDFIKLKLATAYVRLIILARHSVIGLIIIFLILNSILFGIVLVAGGVFYFLPWSLDHKVAGALVIGVLLLIIAGFSLYQILSEKSLFRIAGLKNLIEELNKSAE